jgi:hypothetical protein
MNLQLSNHPRSCPPLLMIKKKPLLLPPGPNLAKLKLASRKREKKMKKMMILFLAWRFR